MLKPAKIKNIIGEKNVPNLKALRFGTFFSPIIFLIFAGLSIHYSPNIEIEVFYSVLTGAVGGIMIGLITEYYTGGDTEDSPVGKIAKSGETGPATVMITGR